MIRCLISLTLAIFLGLPPALALARMEGENKRTLTVKARTERFVTPDVAWLTLAVESRNKVASRAVADNTRRTQEVIERLQSEIGKEGKIYTLGYELFPYYDRPAPRPPRGRPMEGIPTPSKEPPEGEGKFPEVQGYIVRNRVQLETESLQRLGNLIDLAVVAGADRVEGLSFTAREESYRLELLQESIRKVREEAEVLAKALGVKIVRVLEASPNVTFPFPRRMAGKRAFALGASAATPIQPKEVRVEASVTVIYEIE